MSHATESTLSYIEDHWTNDGISFYTGTNTQSLVDSIGKAFDDLADDVSDIYNFQHIDSAEGVELDVWGRAVNLPRKTGEADDKYRIRIKLQFRLNFISGTYDEVTEFTLAVLNTTADEVNFEQRFSQDPAAVYINAQESVFDTSPLTAQEIVDFIGQVVPAGHDVKIEQEGTFIVIDDGDTVNDPATGLTEDGSSQGGTLTEDI